MPKLILSGVGNINSDVCPIIYVGDITAFKNPFSINSYLEYWDEIWLSICWDGSGASRTDICISDEDGTILSKCDYNYEKFKEVMLSLFNIEENKSILDAIYSFSISLYVIKAGKSGLVQDALAISDIITRSNMCAGLYNEFNNHIQNIIDRLYSVKQLTIKISVSDDLEEYDSQNNTKKTDANNEDW